MIVHMLLAEILGILLAKHLVEVFACICQLVGTRYHERVVGYVDDAFKVGHLGLIDDSSHIVTNKQQFSLAVVYDVVNLVGSKLVQYRHGHSSVCECSKESHSPTCAIATA